MTLRLLLAVSTVCLIGTSCGADAEAFDSPTTIIPIVDTTERDPTAPSPTSLPDPIDPANTVVVMGRPHQVSDTVMVTFDAVTEDSRCPGDGDVQCAWEGELSGTITWSDDGVDHPLDLIWAYHHDPTITSDGNHQVGLWDVVRTDDGHVVAHLRIDTLT
ncbi:MAG: hypothetical protein ACR2QE_15585 [Acidimicrobiales bacterium]